MILQKAWLTLTILSLAGCGGSPKVVRGSQSPGLDQAAYSTGLDRHDLQQMLHENLSKLWNAPITNQWQNEARTGTKARIAVMPIRNETSEHLDSELNALLSDIETEMINANLFQVVSLENQKALMDEIKFQQTSGFNQAQVAQWGKQLGVGYVVTGKVYATDERAAESRRVQYHLFIQVLKVETSEIVFQSKSAVTKAIVS